MKTYESRLQFAIERTVLFNGYAEVPSTTQTLYAMYKYTVKISRNNFAYACNCRATVGCIHMDAVNAVLATKYSSFYERVGLVKTTPVADVLQSACDAMLTQDEIAATASAQDVLQRRTRFFQWKAEQEADAMAYEYCAAVEKQQDMLPLCDGCCRLFQPRYSEQTTCDRCDR